MLKGIAQSNVEKLKSNLYPGRGMVLGLSEDGTKLYQIYWIMGRSENSRNRVFVEENGFVRTRAYDESKVTDPSLIIYYPIKNIGNCHIVSNGDQTDTVFDYISSGKSVEAALMTRSFEPDAPNFTPRITGIMDLGGRNAYSISILKTLGGEPNTCVRNFYNYEKPINGLGHCIHTYECDGDVLPSFTGEPYLMPIPDGVEFALAYYWDILNQDNIISLLVKAIDIKTGKVEISIRNKHNIAK